MKRKAIAMALCALVATTTVIGSGLTAPKPVFAATQSVTENRAPVITVGSNKFLVEKGTSFDLKSKLGLTVQDDHDGNITSQVPVPKVDTSQVGLQTIELSATDSGGLNSTQRVTVNVIEIEQTAKFDRFSAVSNCTPSSYVNGNKTGLTITLGTLYEDKSCFQINISDGSNTIQKLITATDYQGVPFANDEGKVWYQGQWIPADQWANREAYVQSHPADGSQVGTGDGTAPGDADSYITGTDGPGSEGTPDDSMPGQTYDADGNLITLDEDGNPVEDSESSAPSNLPKTEDVVKVGIAGACIIAVGGLTYLGIRKKRSSKAEQ